jgi:chromosome partitioning protein
MPGRSVIVGFVSQKGGTGKSTLARALGAVVAAAGLRVKIADLDPQQETVIEWERIREENSTVPVITVEAFDTAAEAIASAEENELLNIDAPAGANRGTLEIAQAATLVVQPSGASIDDLRPAVLLFHELVQAGIPRERMVVALCRILSEAEEDMARAYVTKAGYDVLPGCIPERTAYREAHNRGQAVTETKHKALNARVDELMEGLYARVASQLAAGRRRAKATARKRKDAS